MTSCRYRACRIAWPPLVWSIAMLCVDLQSTACCPDQDRKQLLRFVPLQRIKGHYICDCTLYLTTPYQHTYYVQFTVDLTVIPFVLPSLQLLIHSLASLAPSAACTTSLILSGSKCKFCPMQFQLSSTESIHRRHQRAKQNMTPLRKKQVICQNGDHLDISHCHLDKRHSDYVQGQEQNWF